MQQVLEQRLGLQLSREKTKVTSYGKGYAFLGFSLSSRSRRMRPKSVKKFKDKIRELTRRKHNLDAARIEELTESFGERPNTLPPGSSRVGKCSISWTPGFACASGA